MTEQDLDPYLQTCTTVKQDTESDGNSKNKKNGSSKKQNKLLNRTERAWFKDYLIDIKKMNERIISQHQSLRSERYGNTSVKPGELTQQEYFIKRASMHF